MSGLQKSWFGRNYIRAFFLRCFIKRTQNSWIFSPCWPKAGPTGGAGLALPAGICNLQCFNFFAMFVFEWNEKLQTWASRTNSIINLLFISQLSRRRFEKQVSDFMITNFGIGTGIAIPISSLPARSPALPAFLARKSKRRLLPCPFLHYFLHFAVKVLERSVINFHWIASRHINLVFRLIHAHSFLIDSISRGSTGVGVVPKPMKPVTFGVLRTTYQEASVTIISTKT